MVEITSEDDNNADDDADGYDGAGAKVDAAG